MKVLLLKLNDIISPIPILKDTKIGNFSEQKDIQSSNINDDSATKSFNVTIAEWIKLEYLKEQLYQN